MPSALNDQRAGRDREELARAGVHARTRLDQIEADIAGRSQEELDTTFREVRDVLLGKGGSVEQLTRDLLAHGEIAPGHRTFVAHDDNCLWELLAMLEVRLRRLRRELTDTEFAARGIG